VSLVTFPMLPSARVGAKSEDVLITSEDESLRAMAAALKGLSADLART
jgi:phage head maturation protease